MGNGEHHQEARVLLAELAELGYEVSNNGERPRRYRRYATAIPVLLRWLPEVHDFGLKVDIAHALAVRWARPSPVATLVDEYRLAASDPTLQWMLGDALAKVADERHFEEVVALAKHRRYGKAREMVVVALGNMRDPRAVTALLELLADEEVAGHAIVALGKLRAQAAREAITAFLGHPNAWLRTEARRALGKIGEEDQRDTRGGGRVRATRPAAGRGC